MIKTVIVVMFIAMVISLSIALYHLLKTPDERDSGDRVVKALTWRVGIWIVLLGFIFVAMKMGWIEPTNSVHPAKYNQEQQERIDQNIN